MRACKNRGLSSARVESAFVFLEAEHLHETAAAIRSQMDCFYENIQHTNVPDILFQETLNNIKALLQEVYFSEEAAPIFSRFQDALAFLFLLFKKENVKHVIIPPVLPVHQKRLH